MDEYRLCRTATGIDETELLQLIGIYGFAYLPEKAGANDVLYRDRGLGKYKAHVIQYKHEDAPPSYDIAVYVRRLVFDDVPETAWEQCRLA